MKKAFVNICLLGAYISVIGMALYFVISGIDTFINTSSLKYAFQFSLIYMVVAAEILIFGIPIVVALDKIINEL